MYKREEEREDPSRIQTKPSKKTNGKIGFCLSAAQTSKFDLKCDRAKIETRQTKKRGDRHKLQERPLPRCPTCRSALDLQSF